MDNKIYDVLKWIAMVVLPALGTLYFALAGIWNFPYGEEVVGTITAVDAFLGALLGISTANYKKASKTEYERREHCIDFRLHGYLNRRYDPYH